MKKRPKGDKSDRAVILARRQEARDASVRSEAERVTYRESVAVREAFPAGLRGALTRLGQGEVEAMEAAVLYLERDPYEFRSGYVKVELLKHLRRVALPDAYAERLRHVVLQVLRGSDRREMRAYCLMAGAVATPEFIEELHGMARSGLRYTGRHAEWALSAIAARLKRTD